MLNETHDPALRSWVDSAHDPGTDFPIQNLPLGVFRPRGSEEAWRVGVAIGDSVLDVAACARSGLFDGAAARAGARCAAPTLNGLMALDPMYWRALRHGVSRLLRADTDEGARAQRHRREVLLPRSDAELKLPADVGDYTDFYASVHHATNVGKLFRPDNPLLPNYKWVPIGYHGRASSLVVSGTPVRRPCGQTSADAAKPPAFGPSARLDYELEVGFLVGGENALGERVTVDEAGARLFGVTLLNDWSARDIQTWEYQPLGPFLAKSFASSLSPWVVMMEALAPFRVPASTRAGGDPAPLPYLSHPDDARHGGIDVQLEVYLCSAQMRQAAMSPLRLSRSTLADLYWTPAQFIAHHTSNGCNLRPGDLLGSGTVSGAAPDARGCLLELTAGRGAEPVRLPTGEERRFLADGDEVILRGWCEREGAVRVGLGECSGVVLPALV